MKIICLVGKSSSGKNAILDGVVKQTNTKNLVSYTTRPMRKNEVDGVDYRFVSKKEFEYMIDNNEFIEERKYLVADGSVWYYGLAKHSINLDSDNNYIVILDLQGLYQLGEYLREENKEDCLTSVYIKADGDIRLKRSLNRDNCTDDVVSEICRRYCVDEVDMKDAENVCDITLRNNLDESLNECIQAIKEMLERNE